MIKAILKQFNGFDTILAPFQTIFSVIVPRQPIEFPGGHLMRLYDICQNIALYSSPLIMFFFVLPAISGFMKLPWSEMVGISVGAFIIWLSIRLKTKMGVSA